MSSPTTTPGGSQASNFTVFYVILGGAALLSTVAFPVTFMFALRRYRRRSQSLQLGAQQVIYGGDLQQQEPKLFDVYVKPGLEVREARLEYILPMAVRVASKQRASSASDALSSPSNILRARYPSRSRDIEVDKPEALEDDSQTYDAAVLIVMPHPHAADLWSELGEYSIGTTKLIAPVSWDASTPP